jgi:hypothetical protein
VVLPPLRQTASYLLALFSLTTLSPPLPDFDLPPSKSLKK